MSAEELEQILKIGPKTALTSIQICDAITKFWYENPEQYRKVMEDLELAEQVRDYVNKRSQTKS